MNPTICVHDGLLDWFLNNAVNGITDESGGGHEQAAHEHEKDSDFCVQTKHQIVNFLLVEANERLNWFQKIQHFEEIMSHLSPHSICLFHVQEKLTRLWLKDKFYQKSLIQQILQNLGNLLTSLANLAWPD